ncbi:MAG: RNA polymerase sigma factor [Bacillota bacterium]
MEERLLIQKAQNGDAVAVEELLSRYEERIYKLAARFFSNPQDAGDVAQEAMIRIYERLGSYSWRAAFSTWIYRITVNLCIDETRHRKKQPIQELPENMVSGHAGPEERAVQDETGRQVRAAIASLSPEYRAVLVLREIEGLEYGEIEVILGLASGTVKSRLNRARDAFRKQFAVLSRRGEGHAVC